MDEERFIKIGFLAILSRKNQWSVWYFLGKQECKHTGGAKIWYIEGDGFLVSINGGDSFFVDVVDDFYPHYKKLFDDIVHESEDQKEKTRVSNLKKYLSKWF